MTLIPPRLRPGDTIGVVTPSAQIADAATWELQEPCAI